LVYEKFSCIENFINSKYIYIYILIFQDFIKTMDRVYEETVQEKDKQIEVLKVHSVATGICSLFF